MVLFFRRWVPSTIANIFDLIRDYKKTVRVNDNISMPYIGYQVMLMVGTIIGPGTIFLMLVGAFVAAFKISNWVAFGYNLIPILVYMFVCLNLPSKYQGLELFSVAVIEGPHLVLVCWILKFRQLSSVECPNLTDLDPQRIDSDCK